MSGEDIDWSLKERRPSVKKGSGDRAFERVGVQTFVVAGWGTGAPKS